MKLSWINACQNAPHLKKIANKIANVKRNFQIVFGALEKRVLMKLFFQEVCSHLTYRKLFLGIMIVKIVLIKRQVLFFKVSRRMLCLGLKKIRPQLTRQ